MNNNTVKNIRRFNRYYTAWLDVMNKGYLGTDFSWPESRVLFEIYLCPGITATDICRHLRMDKSYVSRILSRFEKQGFISRELIPGSKGLKQLYLTGAGEKEAKEIDSCGDRQIIEKLGSLDTETCEKLCNAMTFIEKTLREEELHHGQ